MSVRQGMRLIAKPGAFFNQLQWSTHHWMILVVFALVASVETHIGKNHLHYQVLATMLSQQVQISWQAALWAVTSAKLVVFLAAAFALSSLVWFVGTLFGKRTSKRVLFRRLSIVFTVLLTAYTLSHLAHLSPYTVTVSTVLYAWGAILGFFAIREQFALRLFEGVAITVFASFMLLGAWELSREKMEEVSRSHLAKMATQQRFSPIAKVPAQRPARRR